MAAGTNYNQERVIASLEQIQTQLEKLSAHVGIQNGRISKLETKTKHHDEGLLGLETVVSKTNEILENHALVAGGAEKLTKLLEDLAKEKQIELWREKLLHRVTNTIFSLGLFAGGVATVIFAIYTVIH